MEQVKDFPNYLVTRDGRVISKYTNREIGCSDVLGYRRAALYKDGEKYTRKIHRIVAETFIPNPENKPQVNHKNGNKSDNRVENLEWATAAENGQHAYDTGLNVSQKGEKHGGSKLSKESVLEIRQNAQGLTLGALGEKYGVSIATISFIINRKTWQHI